MKRLIWTPKYSITPEIARALMEIEDARVTVSRIPLSPASEAELRRKARIKSTHYSTYIEGNRLTLEETEDVIVKRKVSFHGRERDVKEVQSYWAALLKVEELSARKTELSENLIKKLHAVVMKGKCGKPSEYRSGQNVIKDSKTGAIVYLPPEAKDVPLLMKEMIRWGVKATKEKIPPPLVAAFVHYQFVTIHPYYDGNGRTARLLATFILQRDGYGLNGFFSLEEHHAYQLEEYYRTLNVGKHHNYYEGRAEADLSGWLQYFICLMADVFKKAKDEVSRYSQDPIKSQPQELMKLDRRARAVLALFTDNEFISTAQISDCLSITQRMARYLMKRWIKEGWLLVADKSNKNRKYRLSEKYRKFIKQ